MTDTTKLSRFEELELIEGLLEFRLELRANASDALAEISQLGPDASDSLLISEGIDPGRLKRLISKQRAGSARAATFTNALIDAVEQWVSKNVPISMFPTFDLAFSSTDALSDSRLKEQPSKLGRRIMVADLVSRTSSQNNWYGAEIRLILSFSTPTSDIIDDVSVTLRGEGLEERSSGSLELRLEDKRGNQKSIVLSGDKFAGYLVGPALCGEANEIEISARIVDPHD